MEEDFKKICDVPILDRETMERHGWSHDDRSLNIFLKTNDNLTCYSRTNTMGSIRGRTGYSRGFHVWQLTWPLREDKVRAVIEVGTEMGFGHTMLLGENEESYGWDIINNTCYNGTLGSPYPYSGMLFDDNFTVPDKFYCILNMDEGYMGFGTDKEFLGVAFIGLKGKTLYPMVSLDCSDGPITIQYRGGRPSKLKYFCRKTILLHLGRDRLDKVNELGVPPALQEYLRGQV